MTQLDNIEDNLIKSHWKGFYNFTRQTVSLSAGALTLTISLQKFYIPSSPSALWLLQFAWVLWILTLLFGFLVLHGECQIPLDYLNHIRKVRDKNGDNKTILLLQINRYYKVRLIYNISYNLMFSCFLSAILSITIFALINVFKI